MSYLGPNKSVAGVNGACPEPCCPGNSRSQCLEPIASGFEARPNSSVRAGLVFVDDDPKSPKCPMTEATRDGSDWRRGRPRRSGRCLEPATGEAPSIVAFRIHWTQGTEPKRWMAALSWHENGYRAAIGTISGSFHDLGPELVYNRFSRIIKILTDDDPRKITEVDIKDVAGLVATTRGEGERDRHRRRPASIGRSNGVVRFEAEVLPKTGPCWPFSGTTVCPPTRKTKTATFMYPCR